MRVLITDGDERSALAAARSLVAAGYEVCVTAARRLSLAGVSQGVRRVVVQPAPLEDPVAYAAELGRIARELRVAVLLPVTDPSVEAVLEHREALPDCVALPLPDLATYQRASDKVAVASLARAAGLAIPETVVVRTPADGAGVPPAGFFPAVLKPHRSVVPAVDPKGARRKVGVSYVEDADSCRAALAALPAGAFPVLLQRRVWGPGVGLFVLRWAGRVIATFAHRRLREQPPAGGVSVYRESISVDPTLAAAGTRLLELLDWQGVAMVECKRDLATGRYVFMEVNGRLWGSLQLAIDAGVDFPVLLAACALGRPVAARNGYRAGVRSRWLWGDVDHLYLRLTRSARALHLDGAPASRLAALCDFFRWPGDQEREEVWRPSDPAPFILESLRRVGLPV